MNEFEGIRKMIKVKELYRDKFLPNVSRRLNFAHGITKSKKIIKKDLSIKSKSPNIEPNYSGSGMVIRTIGAPTEMRKVLTPKFNKSIIFTGETRANSEFKKYLLNDQKEKNQSFLDFGIRSKKAKFTLSLIAQKVERKIQTPKKTNRKIVFMDFMDTLSGWET